MAATAYVLDLNLDENGERRRRGRPAKSTNPKQIRARARRHRIQAADALDQLYKPIEQWDSEELARGRPRAADGTWRGAVPPYIDRALHEKIIARFQDVVRGEMREQTVLALEVMKRVLEDKEEDENGRWVVSAADKLKAATFLIEHVVGKPTQRTETDISIKLQGILGMAMVNPDGEYTQAYGELGRADFDDDAIIDAEIVEDRG